nr:sugar porter family MFS transporter [Marinibactrum halimedae]
MNLGFVILVSCVATLGGFLFGFDSGVINGTVDGLQTAFNSSSAGTGWNVASMLLGCMVGAAGAGWLADKFGRRTMLMVSAVLFLVSAWGSGVATGSGEFVIYRLLGGLAVGAASVMSPAYISEIAPAAYRGRLATVQQIAIICGLSAAFFSNYVLAAVAGESTAEFWMGFEAWRWMFWVEIIPAGLFFIMLFFIPESPRYLVLNHQEKKALDILSKVNGFAQAQKVVSDIQQSLSEDKPSLRDLIDKSTGKVRTIVWVGIGLATFQQLVGINVVFYYGAVLWQSVGFSENDALLINVISGVLSIGAVVVALMLVDRIGRKPLLWIGSMGMAFTLFIMALCFASGSFDSNGELVLGDSVGTVALIAANAYVVFFNASWGPVMWVMLGEMFPNQIRGSGLAVSGGFQWGSNFLITWTFPIFLTGIGLAGAYTIYAVFAAISVFFVFKLIHETRGMTLEEMYG